MLSALALKYKARSRVRIGLLVVAALALAPVAMLPAHAATSAGDGPVSVDAPYVKANGRPIVPGDAIAPCGTNLRQENEPTSAVDATQALDRDVRLQRLLHRRGGRRHLDRLLPLAPTPAATGPTRCCRATRPTTRPRARPARCTSAASRNAGDPVQAWDARAGCSTWATRSTVWRRRTVASGSPPTTSTPRTTSAP